MNVTHETLISLGFVRDPNNSSRYFYDRFHGYLTQEGLFYFYGFSPKLSTIQDLKFAQMLIDYQRNASEVPYPSGIQEN